MVLRGRSCTVVRALTLAVLIVSAASIWLGARPNKGRAGLGRVSHEASAKARRMALGGDLGAQLKEFLSFQENHWIEPLQLGTNPDTPLVFWVDVVPVAQSTEAVTLRGGYRTSTDSCLSAVAQEVYLGLINAGRSEATLQLRRSGKEVSVHGIQDSALRETFLRESRMRRAKPRYPDAAPFMLYVLLTSDTDGYLSAWLAALPLEPTWETEEIVPIARAGIREFQPFTIPDLALDALCDEPEDENSLVVQRCDPDPQLARMAASSEGLWAALRHVYYYRAAFSDSIDADGEITLKRELYFEGAVDGRNLSCTEPTLDPDPSETPDPRTIYCATTTCRWRTDWDPGSVNRETTP